MAGSVEYKTAQEVRAYLAGVGRMMGALNNCSLDTIGVPSKAPANHFAACGGFPQIAIPMGFQTAGLEVNYNGDLVGEGPNAP